MYWEKVKIKSVLEIDDIFVIGDFYISKYKTEMICSNNIVAGSFSGIMLRGIVFGV